MLEVVIIQLQLGLITIFIQVNVIVLFELQLGLHETVIEAEICVTVIGFV